MIAMLEGLGVDALGMNCGLGPVQMKEILKEVLSLSSLPVIVNPNAGLPRSENGQTVYDIDADTFADLMREIAQMGARVVGGCCGTTPEHIRLTAERCREVRPAAVEKKEEPWFLPLPGQWKSDVTRSLSGSGLILRENQSLNRRSEITIWNISCGKEPPNRITEPMCWM